MISIGLKTIVLRADTGCIKLRSEWHELRWRARLLVVLWVGGVPATFFACFFLLGGKGSGLLCFGSRYSRLAGRYWADGSCRLSAAVVWPGSWSVVRDGEVRMMVSWQEDGALSANIA
jgi:hypothetical protein